MADSIVLTNVRFLITNYQIEETDAIRELGKQLANKSLSFVIISPQFGKFVVDEVARVFNDMENESIGYACFSVGKSNPALLQDIAVITNGNLIAEELGMSLKNITTSELGAAKETSINTACLEIIAGQGKSGTIKGFAKLLMSKIKDTANNDKKSQLIRRYENLTGQLLKRWPEYEPYQERSLEGWKLPYGYASAHFCNKFEPLRGELFKCCVLASTQPVCVCTRTAETQKSQRGMVYPEILKMGDSENNIIPFLEQISNHRLPFLLIAPHIEMEVMATLVANKLRGILNCAAINTHGDIRVIEEMKDGVGIEVINKIQKLNRISAAELPTVNKLILLDDLSIFQL